MSTTPLLREKGIFVIMLVHYSFLFVLSLNIKRKKREERMKKRKRNERGSRENWERLWQGNGKSLTNVPKVDGCACGKVATRATFPRDSQHSRVFACSCSPTIPEQKERLFVVSLLIYLLYTCEVHILFLLFVFQG